ncbi:hypothetical protein NDU88_003002 [Pleurodeles waltl]|uniref:Uncharacterized protein n=1 Tax=Pleurodeles waltl TaxID=8319 RepID=A0AAV7LFF4_PLEWA|nr:hypothetical protein NDU88_003002 [Pleurodeles waltl]
MQLEPVLLRDTATGKHSPSNNRASRPRQRMLQQQRLRQPCTPHIVAAQPGNRHKKLCNRQQGTKQSPPGHAKEEKMPLLKQATTVLTNLCLQCCNQLPLFSEL